MTKYRFLFLSILLFLLYLGSSCQSEKKERTTSDTLFRLIPPSESGISFKNELKENVSNNFNVMAHQYFYRGAGVAVGDINNDGLQDVFFTANMGPDKLYLNKGGFKFEDISQKAGFTEEGWSTGVVMVDINQDGYQDIYICRAGPSEGKSRENKLYLNNKNLTFTETAQSFGLADNNISRNAGFFDYDKDGDLDCYILNESIYTRKPINYIYQQIEDKSNLKKCSGKLFRNDGNNQFTDVTEEAGMLRYGHGLTLNISDINQDGWLDLYVTNDFTPPDFLFINQGDGTFKDEIKKRTKNISWASMGVDIADLNNDQLVDIYTVEMASKDHFMDKTLMPSMNADLFHALINDLNYQRQYKFNTLQLNTGDGNFSNIAGLSGMLKSEWSWSTLLADFDNDGYKDCFISNGYRRYYSDNDSQIKLRKIKRQNKGKVPNAIRQEFYNNLPVKKSKNLMFRNTGDLIFEDYSKEWGVGAASFSNGISYCDLDNDGDLDLIVNNIDDFPFLYENTSNVNNFLKIQLNSKLPSIGTKALLSCNGQTQYLEYSPHRGYLSSTEQGLIFGLGDAKKIDKLTIVWPNGNYQTLPNPTINSTLQVYQKDAIEAWNYKNEIAKPYFKENKEISALYSHQENDFDDFEKEVLLPYKQSTLGPLMSSGDVDQNGLQDFFIGGAAGSSGALFLQKKDGSFSEKKGPWSQFHEAFEDSGSLMFDADGDQDLDLLVLSGGNEFQKGNPIFQDRLYINDGKGNFSYAQESLPYLEDIAYRVKSLDIDKDGDQDLFLGGRLIPQFYPNPPKSYVLINNGSGSFSDESENWLGDIQRLGLVNDILVHDFNEDGKTDLLVCGEFMDIKLLINSGKELEEATSQYFPDSPKGWWMSLEKVDINKDGKMDIIAGNLGLNSKFTATPEKPFEMIVDNFDANGSCDIVILKDYKGKKVPLRGRQCSSEQMPFIAEKFPNYKDFANASIEDILGKEASNKAQKFTSETFESSVFIYENGGYSRKPLPNIAQSFPIHDIAVEDLNKDGNMDIIIVGNLYHMEVETPRIDAGNGLVLLGSGTSKFNPVSMKESGLNIPKECRSIQSLNSTSGEKMYLFSQNNDAIKGYIFRTKG